MIISYIFKKAAKNMFLLNIINIKDPNQKLFVNESDALKYKKLYGKRNNLSEDDIIITEMIPYLEVLESENLDPNWGVSENDHRIIKIKDRIKKSHPKRECTLDSFHDTKIIIEWLLSKGYVIMRRREIKIFRCYDCLETYDDCLADFCGLEKESLITTIHW